MSFPERLKFLRTRKKLTQQQLADDLQISRTAVAGYERLGKQPNFDVLIRMAEYFNVSTDYLVGHSDKEFIQDTSLHFIESFDRIFTENKKEKISERSNFANLFYALYTEADERHLGYAVFDALFMIMDDLFRIFSSLDSVEEQYKDLRINSSSIDLSTILANAFLADVQNIPNNTKAHVEKVIYHIHETILEEKRIPGRDSLYIGNHR